LVIDGAAHRRRHPWPSAVEVILPRMLARQITEISQLIIFETDVRFSAAVAFLMHPPEDSLASGLNDQDQRLLAAYRRVFGGRLNCREANRLLGCLGSVQF
jgi:hypothetical protein